MELTKTRRQVLKVLYDYNDWLSATEIKSYSKEFINYSHVRSALIKFMDNDYVFYNHVDDKFLISPDGRSAYLSSNSDH